MLYFFPGVPVGTARDATLSDATRTTGVTAAREELLAESSKVGLLGAGLIQRARHAQTTR
jgi:hypothetical protein